jgi:DegV family protein with EDD domain
MCLRLAMGNIAIVTDTSSDLTPQQAEAAGVRLVPLTVSFGDESFTAGIELSNEEFYERLTAAGAPMPRTAAPNPAQFEAAYREAFDAGAEGVVCVNISEKLSGTYAAAVQGASAFEAGQVQVIDSMTTTWPLGLIVRRAAELASTGASQSDVVDLAQDLVGRNQLLFAPDTLEYLQKGGRIGRASAMVGTVLSIKPILTVVDGETTSLDRKRTMGKARARILELAGVGDVEQIAVVHSGASGLDEFRAAAAEVAGCSVDDVEVGSIGPVAGAHIGPGMIGISRILAG